MSSGYLTFSRGNNRIPFTKLEPAIVFLKRFTYQWLHIYFKYHVTLILPNMECVKKLKDFEPGNRVISLWLSETVFQVSTKYASS